MSALRQTAFPRSRAFRGELSGRWSVTTCLALLAVTCTFVDSLLTVEAQRVSIEADSLRKKMETVSVELGALESRWAAASSQLELGARAEELGLSVPEQGQVVLLPSSLLEDELSGAVSASDELRRGLFNTWIRLALMRTP